LLFFTLIKIKYANNVVKVPIVRLVCTVSPVAAIMIKARNTITAYSIPDFRNWPEAGTREMIF